VIEQAKGVLSERLGLDIEGAFSVLRGAARFERLKAHALATAVVEERDTSSRDERVARTQDFFKRVNDTMRKELGDGDGNFLCECGNIACTEKLALSSEDLRLLHSIDGYLVVLPGHEIPEIESLVKVNGRYAIVHNKMR